MSRAVASRREGDTFQARLFWLKAARLLDPESAVNRVGFEVGPKGFDDVWTEYDAARAPRDQEGSPLVREHIQSKWHVAPGSYGYAELIDPEFINADSQSLLQRAYKAHLSFAPDGRGSRFKLATNFRIGLDDPLCRLVRQRSSALRLDLLFNGRTDRSQMGRVRKTWREHLGIDDSQLNVFARTLAFGEVTDNLDDLRDHLDDVFRVSGLKRVPKSQSGFIYDDVAFKWLDQGRQEFDRGSFQEICKSEGLVAVGIVQPRPVGVKSFEHPIDRLEDRCSKVLDLVPSFDQRFIRSEEDWNASLYPAIKAFLLDAAKDQGSLRLALDSHSTLAFAAGSVLDIKSGREIELEQRVGGLRVWSARDSEPDASWPRLECQIETVHAEGSELAVAIGLTHDVSKAVRSYLAAEVPSVGRMLVATPSTGPGARAVASGRHAFDLAESLLAGIRAERAGKATGTVHLFMACPNAVAFFLGQRQVAIGSIKLYEFDFEGARGGSYRPSLGLPVPAKARRQR